MRMAALASVWTATSTVTPKSASSAMSTRLWAAPFVKAYSFASALDSATMPGRSTKSLSSDCPAKSSRHWCSGRWPGLPQGRS